METATPQPTAPQRTTRRLYRLTDQRRWAGVAAGIGWYLGIDPVLVRIAFVVAGFSTGPLAVGAYFACWALMPARRTDELDATPPPPSDGRTRGLTALGIIIALGLLGVLNWSSGQVILAAGLIGIGVLIFQGGAPARTFGPPRPTRTPTVDAGEEDPGEGWESMWRWADRQADEASAETSAGPDRWCGPRGTRAPADQDSQDAPPTTPQPQSAYGRDYAGAWRQRRGPGPRPPWMNRPRVERSRLGAVVVAVGMIAFGFAAFLDTVGVVSLTPSRGLGLGVLMAGVGLTVATVFGRARWLIPVGLVGTMLLVGVSAVETSDGAFPGPVGEFTYAPTTVSQVRDTYRVALGELTVDLTDLEVPPGDTVDIDIEAGLSEVTVVVPSTVNLELDGEVNLGEADLFGTADEGNDVDLELTRDGAGPDAGTLTIDVDQAVGSFTITDGGPR